MSRFSGQSSTVTSNPPEDKKIFFKGLEKCVEAFTSGEGRLVRKYARLFSQLSGQRYEDEEEAISWSSSDEDDGGATSHNAGVVRRSKVTRKLNSQINFESRINAKKNGRRLTSAEFSRSVEYLSQTVFPINSDNEPVDLISNQVSHAKTDDSSLINTGLLINRSVNLMLQPEETQVKDNHFTVPLTPCLKSYATNSKVTSPVFKLNASCKRKVQKRRPRNLICFEDEKTCESSQDKVKTVLCLPETLPLTDANICSSPPGPFLPLTPENKMTKATFITSPVWVPSVSNYSEAASSPVLKGAESLSPVMRKTVRRRRPHNTSLPTPASPILESKKKISTFSRKRRKLASFESSRLSCNTTSHIGDLPTCELLQRDTHSVDPGSSNHTVKRSLDFTLDKEYLNPNKIITESDVSIETTSKSDHPFLNDSSVNLPCPSSDPLNLPEEDLSENILSATNFIEDVNTEELDLPIPSKPSHHNKNRLSLRSAFTQKSGSIPEIIENTQTQCLIGDKTMEDLEITFKTPILRAICPTSTKIPKPSEESTISPPLKSDFLNQTNLIEEVYTEELDLPERFKTIGVEKKCADKFEEIQSPHRKENDHFVHDENSMSQVIPSSQFLPEKQNVDPSKSKQISKSLIQSSETMRKEFHRNFPTKDTEELIISQSSTRSGDRLKNGESGSPEIESVSSQVSRENKDTSGPSTGPISKSNCTRSPAVSSPLVISSAGSSPGVKSNDQPFIIIEDEHNAPPKRRSKKLDPNGLASRLQRLLNQRRSAARIWQYKRSRMNRLNNEEEGKIGGESQGRVLTVFSVRTDYSHIVLCCKEEKGERSNGKEFSGSVLVILDPGVVLRLGKVMNASRIKIFPPWQSMDFQDRGTTVILGANLVEVLSTGRNTNSVNVECEESGVVKRYNCSCSYQSVGLRDAIMLECWDGAQSVGLLDILFPLAIPLFIEVVQFDENTLQTLQCLEQINLKQDQTKYTIKALLSNQSTASHGKGLLVLTVLRVFSYWQRCFELTSKRETLPHWSILGRDSSNEVCELVLGSIQTSEAESRLDWSDFIAGRSLGKKYKFRDIAVSQRLSRSRLAENWDIIPDEQKIIYILVASNDFSFSKDEVSEPVPWEPQVAPLASVVHDESNKTGHNKDTRVSFVCRIFHANEHTLYVSDQSVSPQLFPVLLRPSVYIPPIVFAAVLKPKPTNMLALLQDVQASKARIVADKYSRIIILNDNGNAYPESCCREKWPASPEICSVLQSIRIVLPHFSSKSRLHSLVKLTGVVSNLDETSALMWPACGSCGSHVDTGDKKLRYCDECSKECKELIVHMSLTIFVRTPDLPNDTSIRVKILNKTVQTLIRTIPKEGQDIMVREAIGKPIGPIRCEIMASHGGKFVLNELPSSLWM